MCIVHITYAICLSIHLATACADEHTVSILVVHNVTSIHVGLGFNHGHGLDGRDFMPIDVVLIHAFAWEHNPSLGWV